MSDIAHILFLSRESASEALRQIWSKLLPREYQCTCATTPIVTPDWLTQNVPPGTQAIVFAEKDALWRESAMSAVRTSSFRFLPLLRFFGGDEKLDAPGLAGFDDFILASDGEYSALRLSLRLKEGRQRAEADKAFKEQLVQLAKADTTLKQREEFLSVCAHDLRSPLGLIQSSLALFLNAKPELPEFHVELLNRAKRQAGQAIGLVNDLLDVMSYEQGLKPDYQFVDLNALLTEFHRDYSFQAEQKQVKVHYENPVADWRVLADADRIRQLLQNLFTNALKFTDSGKNIYIKASPFQGRRKTDPAYPMIIISLKDEGKGIPQSEMQKIFDRFAQIKSHARADGRGLGLTVAKQISTLHDGNIWVESQEGQGSTFFVLFPHVVSRVNAPEQDSKKQLILIAEPSAARQKEIFSSLGNWGFELLFARDGIEALTLLYHRWPSALILTPELTKVASAEVANLIKSDPLGGQIPILLAGPSKKSMLVDGQLPVPFTQDQWKQIWEQVQKRSAHRKAA